MKEIHNNYKLFISILIGVILLKSVPAYAQQNLYFVGSSNNDLYQLLKEENIPCNYIDKVDVAFLNGLKPASSLIVVANSYPNQRTEFTQPMYDIIKRKRIRVFLEFPSEFPDKIKGKDVYKATLERGVVSSSFFGKALPEMSIIGLNGVHIIPVHFKKPLLSFAKIAGFDKALYGLKDTEIYPLLIQQDNILIATTKISNFHTGRFGPSDSWKVIWERILTYVSKQDIQINNWSADPQPIFSADEILPEDARKTVVSKGTEWFWKARLFIHPSWEKEMLDKYQPKGGDPNLYFGPAINKDMLIGDGSRGIMEGHASEMDYEGVQKYRYFVRADVQGESAFLLAASGNLLKKPLYSETAEKLLDYLFYTSDFRGGDKNNKEKDVYGLIGWANTHQGVFFNDDNARCILGAIGASAFMDNQRWNKFIVENILANLRTCSKQGFQGNALNQEQIEEKGWKYYNERDFINPHPHFEAWMWACYLWLYDKTNYKPLLEKAKTGIRIMMENYPDKWHTQNGIQQERAKMILPLSWLVRIEDTEEHRQWLDKVVRKLLEGQVENGAIREELGDNQSDKNKLKILSNKEYGKNEASLIMQNGDPVSDMLYTCNFAFFALNEAAHATQNKQYKQAVTKLADFLMRIQATSKKHIDTDGAWFRAFDNKRWDYWASNADNGWGAWSTLAGWIQTWIVGTQVLVETEHSYWDITKKINVTNDMKESMWMME